MLQTPAVRLAQADFVASVPAIAQFGHRWDLAHPVRAKLCHVAQDIVKLVIRELFCRAVLRNARGCVFYNHSYTS